MNRTILVLCVVSAALCILSSCKARSTRYVGAHRVEIVDRPKGTRHSSLTRMPDGKLIFTYESDETTVRLEDEVLTVNGKTYIIPHKDDSMKIVHDRGGITVEINGQLAKPEGSSG